MSTTAPVSNRTEFTIVNGPGRKMLSTLQVAIDLASDKGKTPNTRVVFTLRDWNGDGFKDSATGKSIRRSVVITSIDWSDIETGDVIAIKGIMARGVKIRCHYDPQMREGELFTENSEMY